MSAGKKLKGGKMSCTKCGVMLCEDNTKHNTGGVVKWCDKCWKEFWDKHRRKDESQR